MSARPALLSILSLSLSSAALAAPSGETVLHQDENATLVWRTDGTDTCGGDGELTFDVWGHEMPMDVMIIVDHSGSIGSANWINFVLPSVQGLAEAVLGQNDNRVGAVVFDTGATLTAHLEAGWSAAQIRGSVTARGYPNGYTNTSAAILAAADELEQHGRPEAARVVVLLTDGEPYGPNNIDVNVCDNEVDRLEELNIHPMIGAVGNWNPNKVSCLLYGDHSDFLFRTNDFADLQTTLGELTDSLPAASNVSVSFDLGAGLMLGTPDAELGTVTVTGSTVTWAIPTLPMTGEYAVDAPDGAVSLTLPFTQDGGVANGGDTLAAEAMLFEYTPANDTVSQWFDVGDGYVELATCDSTPPVVTSVIAGAMGDNGWYVSDVEVSWVVEDAESAVASTSGCDTVTVSSDTAGDTFTCTASSAGGTASASVTIARDATAPVVSFSGGDSIYALTDVVNLDCEASDAMSGVDGTSVDCEPVSGPAWSFGPGQTTFEAWAMDMAGNEGSASETILVVVDPDGLADLACSFADNRGICTSLRAKLDAFERTGNRGPLNAFINEVNAQSGRHLTAEEAAILVAMAGAL